jgi:hypothetical protein
MKYNILYCGEIRMDQTISRSIQEEIVKMVEKHVYNNDMFILTVPFDKSIVGSARSIVFEENNFLKKLSSNDNAWKTIMIYLMGLEDHLEVDRFWEDSHKKMLECDAVMYRDLILIR